MTERDEPKINVDKQGRICDKLGRPLRDRSIRSYKGPFMGREGAPHRRSAHLQKRVKAFDDLRSAHGRTRPGSLKK